MQNKIAMSQEDDDSDDSVGSPLKGIYEVETLLDMRETAGGEREFLIRIDLALNETINVIFNGILSRQNFGLGVIEFIEAGVQRGGLARTSGPGDDHNAIGAFDQVTNRLKVIRAKTDVVQTQLDIASVQNPHHD